MKGETKEARFKRIAERRIQRILDSLRSLSQCSNKPTYSWSDAHLEKTWNAIEDALKSCKESFEEAEPEDFRF